MKQFSRIVIKVGSSLIAPDGGPCSTRYGLAIAQFINELRALGKDVVLVSSGSVAAGKSIFPRFNQKKILTIPEKQALAAIGQQQVLSYWQKFFDFPCGQVLLTHDDMHHRKRYLNAANTMMQLLELKVLPIVNENDTVSVDELKVGDNDNLAAQVAVLARADALLICSDVDGLYTKPPQQDPSAKLVKEIKDIDDTVLAMAQPPKNTLGTGGMVTKLQAAKKASARGIETFIVNGQRGDNFQRLLNGENPGSHFYAERTPLEARKHWLRHAVNPVGHITIDEGAAQAVRSKGASLLSIGIKSIEGSFSVGDAIAVKLENQQQNLAVGIVQFESKELLKIIGKRSEEIVDILGFASSGVVIHRNDLVLN